MNELLELTRLEKKHDVATIVKDNTSFPIDGTMSHWVSGVLLRNDEVDPLLMAWRGVGYRDQKYPDRGNFTIDQMRLLKLPCDDIVSIYENVQDYKRETPPQVLKERLTARIEGDHGHIWNDQYEARQVEKRSLAQMKRRGVEITVQPSDIDEVKREYTEDGVCPVLDRVKNKRIVNINGFDDTKASLTIHDVFDHVWLYDKARESGILDRYRDFMASVGNPQDTDIFKREGELLASVGFEWRCAHNPERRFTQIFDLDRIARILGNSQNPTDNQRRAYAILSELSPENDSGEIARLSRIYSGIQIELMEQRRKHGFIRQLDQNFNPIGNLKITDPEYTALIIESNHLIESLDWEAKRTLLQTELMVEDYLISLALDETREPLTVTLDSLKTFDGGMSRVSLERQAWLNTHLFHTSSRQDFCD